MVRKAIVLFITLVSLSCAQLLGPKATINQTEHNFKDIEQGKIVDHDFIITNTGGDLLKITNVRASCGCTAANPEKSELKPGESTTIEVKFNSSGRMGAQTKYVYITTNDPESSELKLIITGNVIPAESSSNVTMLPRIYFPETQYDFGEVKEGDIVTHTFNFINQGDAILNIGDIKTSCGCTAALVSNKQIAPGKNGTIKVDLNTKNRQGRMSRTITISSNDPEEPNKVITILADVNKVSN